MIDRFTFFRGFFESINQLPDGSRERAYDAVMRYVFLGIEPQLDYPESLVWPVIKPSVDKNMVSVSSGIKGGEASSKKRSEGVPKQNEKGFPTPLGKQNEKPFGTPLPKPIQKGFATPLGKQNEKPFGTPLPNQNQKGFPTTKTKTETMTKTMTETETETTTKTKAVDSQEKENREEPSIPQERERARATSRTPRPRVDKRVYGKFNNVRLTEGEHAKLFEDHPDKAEKMIDDLSWYIAEKGDKYKSHYITILNWIRRDADKKPNNRAAASLDESYRMMADWMAEKGGTGDGG